MASEKTNAMRILDRAKLSYETFTYQSDGAVDGVTVAKKLGQPVQRVFKTLVTKGAGREQYYIFVIPVAAELDLKAAAKSVGEKSVELIPVTEINRVTGYIRGGCSPIGMKKSYPTVLDSSCLTLPAIIFSAGRIGHQIQMEPTALIDLIGAKTAELIHRDGGECL